MAGVPGAKPLAAFLFVVAVAAVVVALRAAGQWRPSQPWRSVIPAATRQAARDLGGSALLLLAAACAATIVALVPITALLICGPLAVATVAVEKRGNLAQKEARRV
jgi:hypothetical protein